MRSCCHYRPRTLSESCVNIFAEAWALERFQMLALRRQTTPNGRGQGHMTRFLKCHNHRPTGWLKIGTIFVRLNFTNINRFLKVILLSESGENLQ